MLQVVNEAQTSQLVSQTRQIPVISLGISPLSLHLMQDTLKGILRYVGGRHFEHVVKDEQTLQNSVHPVNINALVELK